MHVMDGHAGIGQRHAHGFLDGFRAWTGADLRNPPLLVGPDADHLVPSVALIPAQRAQELVHRTDLQFGGAEPRHRVWQVLALADDGLKWLAVPAGGVEIDQRVTLFVVAVLHPHNWHAPPLAAVAHEAQRLLLFLSGIGEAHHRFIRKAAVGLEHAPQHVGRRSATGEADARRAVNLEWVSHAASFSARTPARMRAARARSARIGAAISENVAAQSRIQSALPMFARPVHRGGAPSGRPDQPSGRYRGSGSGYPG